MKWVRNRGEARSDGELANLEPLVETSLASGEASHTFDEETAGVGWRDLKNESSIEQGCEDVEEGIEVMYLPPSRRARIKAIASAISSSKFRLPKDSINADDVSLSLAPNAKKRNKSRFVASRRPAVEKHSSNPRHVRHLRKEKSPRSPEDSREDRDSGLLNPELAVESFNDHSGENAARESREYSSAQSFADEIASLAVEEASHTPDKETAGFGERLPDLKNESSIEQGCEDVEEGIEVMYLPPSRGARIKAIAGTISSPKLRLPKDSINAEDVSLSLAPNAKKRNKSRPTARAAKKHGKNPRPLRHLGRGHSLRSPEDSREDKDPGLLESPEDSREDKDPGLLESPEDSREGKDPGLLESPEDSREEDKDSGLLELPDVSLSLAPNAKKSYKSRPAARATEKHDKNPLPLRHLGQGHSLSPVPEDSLEDKESGLESPGDSREDKESGLLDSGLLDLNLVDLAVEPLDSCFGEDYVARASRERNHALSFSDKIVVLAVKDLLAVEGASPTDEFRFHPAANDVMSTSQDDHEPPPLTPFRFVNRVLDGFNENDTTLASSDASSSVINRYEM